MLGEEALLCGSFEKLVQVRRIVYAVYAGGSRGFENGETVSDVLSEGDITPPFMGVFAKIASIRCYCTLIMPAPATILQRLPGVYRMLKDCL